MKKKTFTFESRTFVDLPRKTMKDKRISLNLNTAALKNFRVYGACKKLYKEIMMEQINNCPVFDKPVTVTFQIFKKTKGRADKSNFFSVISKFLYDAVAESGKLIDDNDNYIKTETLLPTEYKKSDHNLVIITFTEI